MKNARERSTGPVPAISGHTNGFAFDGLNSHLSALESVQVRTPPLAWWAREKAYATWKYPTAQ